MSVFNFGFKNPFANGAPSNEIDAFPDENRGLGIAFDQTDGKPEMKGLNGLFNKITQSLLSIRQNGLLGWVNDLEYIQGGFVIESGKLYQAKRNNTNKQPSLSQNDWQVWASVSDISVSTNGNLKKTVATDGSMTLEVPTATDSQRGVARFATATEVANKSNVSAAINPSNAATIAQSTDLGVGQTWQDVTSSRALGTTYTNNTGRPITVIISLSDAKGNNFVIVGGVNIGDIDTAAQTGDRMTFIVPNSQTYRAEIGFGGTLLKWAELR